MALIRDILRNDLAFALEDAGVPVVHASGATHGVLEQMDEALFEVAQTYGARLTLLIATDSVTVRVGDPITVDDTAYIVRGHQRIGRGAKTRIFLALP
jgi:hypothetical protein